MSYSDQQLNDLVFKAIVPEHLRPETQEEIEEMLDQLGEYATPLSESQIRRILKKVKDGVKTQPNLENNNEAM